MTFREFYDAAAKVAAENGDECAVQVECWYDDGAKLPRVTMHVWSVRLKQHFGGGTPGDCLRGYANALADRSVVDELGDVPEVTP